MVHLLDFLKYPICSYFDYLCIIQIIRENNFWFLWSSSFPIINI